MYLPATCNGRLPGHLYLGKTEIPIIETRVRKMSDMAHGFNRLPDEHLYWFNGRIGLRSEKPVKIMLWHHIGRSTTTITVVVQSVCLSDQGVMLDESKDTPVKFKVLRLPEILFS